MRADFGQRSRHVIVEVRHEGPSLHSDDLLKLFEREGITLNVEPEEARVLREGKVDFIGFSYYNTSVATTSKTAKETDGSVISGASTASPTSGTASSS